MNVALH